MPMETVDLLVGHATMLARLSAYASTRAGEADACIRDEITARDMISKMVIIDAHHAR
jgi:hypothetical protein